MDNGKRQHSCCFFGHRRIAPVPKLPEKLTQTVDDLIRDKGVTYFYFGSKSEFDSLCYKVVTGLKEKYPQIKRIYVRSAFPEITDSYKEYLLADYEETYFPEKMRGAGKAAYVKRNQEMVNQSRFCVVYFDETYAPPRRRNCKRDTEDYQPRSGTKVTYDYAVQKKCEIINIFTKDDGIEGFDKITKTSF